MMATAMLAKTSELVLELMSGSGITGYLALRSVCSFLKLKNMLVAVAILNVMLLICQLQATLQSQSNEEITTKNLKLLHTVKL